MSGELSRSSALAAKTLFAAFQILKEKGGELPGREVIAEVGKRVELDDWARGSLPNSGNVRWQSVLHFYTIDAVKAGFMVKKNGVWYLTPDGERALSLGDVGLLHAAQTAYREWKAGRQEVESPTDDEEHRAYSDKNADNDVTMTLERIEQTALEGLERYIAKKNPYEFQDLVAALLRGMG